MKPVRPADLQPRAEALAATLPPLLVAAERVAATVEQGVHGRRRVGPGESFWQFRRYQPGDSVTAIDWRQSAKSAPVYVRETEWAAAQSIWLWSDRSPSMRWRSDDRLPNKADRAALLTLALATLLARGGERVALLGTGLPPASGRAMLPRLAEMLLDGDEHSLPPARPLPRYARLVLVGDFLQPLPELHARLRSLAAEGVRGHLVQVLDPAEESLPYEGRVRFEGLEGEGQTVVPRAEDLRADYRRALADHREGLATLARANGWELLLHHTDQQPTAPLLALYESLTGR